MPPPAVRIKATVVAEGGDPPPPIILAVPVRIKAGGDAPSRRHSRHPSRPRRRRDDWGVGNPVALASSTYCRFTSARLAPALVRIKAGGDAPSRRHSRHPSRPRRRRDDWGVGNPVALASSTYCRFTSARLAPAPSGSKKVGMPPPAVRIKATVVAEGGDAPSPRQDQSPSRRRRWGCPSRRHSRHPSRPRRRRDDWGVGNPVALASSTYCRFTSARLAPAPVRIKAGGDAPSRRQDQSRWESPSRRQDQSHSPRRRRGSPSRRHSRHPSRPRRRRGCPLPPSFSAPQSSPPKVGMPPPAVRIKALVPAEGGTTGVSGIQWLLQVAPTVVSPQRVLLPPPSGSKKVGMPLSLSGSKPQLSPKVGMPPPSFSPSQLPTTKSWTTGAGGIQWLLQVAPSVVSPQLVLLPLPSGSKP